MRQPAYNRVGFGLLMLLLLTIAFIAGQGRAGAGSTAIDASLVELDANVGVTIND